jgi:hypothetical protein
MQRRAKSRGRPRRGCMAVRPGDDRRSRPGCATTSAPGDPSFLATRKPPSPHLVNDENIHASPRPILPGHLTSTGRKIADPMLTPNPVEQRLHFACGNFRRGQALCEARSSARKGIASAKPAIASATSRTPCRDHERSLLACANISPRRRQGAARDPDVPNFAHGPASLSPA